MEEQKKAIIIGCGLVGSMAAHFLIRKGFLVEIYEKRADFRKSKFIEGRSINLAMSERARKSLRAVGLEEGILKRAVAMKGRLLHYKNGDLKSILYDSVNNQCLYSVSRNDLNLYLINALENNPNLSIKFGCKLTHINSQESSATFIIEENGQTINVKADLIVASDGAYSAVRQELQKNQILNFSQTYIDHGYMELSIDKMQGLKMIPNHLHIWPRAKFMMIALPNLDHSWTVTLFMPFDIFRSIDSPEKLIKFFTETFGDFLSYCSHEKLIDEFFKKNPMPLISIKCDPHHFNRVVLLGDAAHAMVPFYGQGMNAGFEDCFILDEALSLFDIPNALVKYSRWRSQDTHAICDLAMYNYEEMRDLVATFQYRVRKSLDNCLFYLMPDVWFPLYNSVSFSDLGYKKCLENRTWQDKVIKNFAIALILLVILLVILFVVYY